MDDRYFFGKILLFGEYSILAGSDAAITPYRKAGLRMGFLKECKQPDIFLQSFLEYLEKEELCREFLNLSKFERDINEGFTVDSDIPMNKGLGSSGAVCAGIFYYYRIKEPDGINELRNIFARMESWFHGKSSGIDPLCIYYGRTIMKKDQAYQFADESLISGNRFSPFLIDTGRESKTKPLVEHFRDQLGNYEFADDFTKTYIPLVNSATDQWTGGYLSDMVLFAISVEQLRLFRKMIPDEFMELWNEGLKDKSFALKLCGSGGGGMILGFTADMERTQQRMKEKYNLNVISLKSGEKAAIPD